MHKNIRSISINLLCSRDEKCRDELNALVEFVEELDRVASSLPEPVLGEDNNSTSFFDRTTNREQLLRAAMEALGGNRVLADYTVRRRLYLQYRGLVKPAKGLLACPVCGSLPRIVRLAQSEDALFSGYEAWARCTCGMEWPVDEWKCPSCGVEGREAFRVYTIEPGVFEARQCTRCGYMVAVVSSELSQADVALVNLVLESLRAGEEGEGRSGQ